MKAAASTAAVAMILVAGLPFAAAGAPVPERPVSGSPPGPVIEEDTG